MMTKEVSKIETKHLFWWGSMVASSHPEAYSKRSKLVKKLRQNAFGTGFF